MRPASQLRYALHHNCDAGQSLYRQFKQPIAGTRQHEKLHLKSRQSFYPARLLPMQEIWRNFAAESETEQMTQCHTVASVSRAGIVFVIISERKQY